MALSSRMASNEVWCPPELIDHICSFIDQPADLLPISLASKAFRDIVIPNHLQYRRIRCDFRNAAFWKALVKNKSLISQVRYIEIVAIETAPNSGLIKMLPAIPQLRGKNLKTPGAIVKTADDIQEALQSIADAIRCMPLLKRFTWTIDLHPHTEAFSALFQALSESSHLREVEIKNYSGYLYGFMQDSHLGDSKLWDISNLSSFSYAEHYGEYEILTHGTYVRRLSDMLLQKCPGLEDLQLYFTYIECRADMERSASGILRDMFNKARWVKLKRLTVEGAFVDTHFFRNHTSIEALCIRDMVLSELDFTSLNSLRSLEVSWVPEAKELSPIALHNLQHLDITLDRFSANKAGDCLLSNTVNLQSLVIRSATFGPPAVLKNLLGQVASSLKKLALVFDWDNYDLDVEEEDSDENRIVKKTLTEILPSLPALTHFSPAYIQIWAAGDDKEDVELEVPDVDSANTDPKDKEDRTSEYKGSWSPPSEKDILDRFEVAIESLISLAPKLAYVGIKYDYIDSQGHSPTWVIVERDEEGKYDGFFIAQSPNHRQDVDPNLWGDIFYGAGENLIHFWWD